MENIYPCIKKRFTKFSPESTRQTETLMPESVLTLARCHPPPYLKNEWLIDCNQLSIFSSPSSQIKSHPDPSMIIELTKTYIKSETVSAFSYSLKNADPDLRLNNTICPRSSYPFDILSYHKMGKYFLDKQYGFDSTYLALFSTSVCT